VKPLHILLLICTAPLITHSLSAQPAKKMEAGQNGAGKYAVQPRSSLPVDLTICGRTQLEVRGDRRTDLDFTIRDPNGTRIHRDIDRSDASFAILSSQGTCDQFSLTISNPTRISANAKVELINADKQRGILGEGEYDFTADEARKIPLRVCTQTNVYVQGTDKTDIDFDVTDIRGNPIHSDHGLSDTTQFTLNPADGCTHYNLIASNMGDIATAMTVRFDDKPNLETLSTSRPAPFAQAAMIGRGPGEYTAPARASVGVTLTLCERAFLSIKGSGTSDLDFAIQSGSAGIMYSDYDRNDATYTSLSPITQCETFTALIKNPGDAANAFTISLHHLSKSDKAAGDDRNITLVNQTDEALEAIYWSNSGTEQWGDDRLGSTATLAIDQQWPVSTDDGSEACLFDFKAETGRGRTFEISRVNVCDTLRLVFE